MIKNYGHKKRRKFDMDADWLPQKNRPFAMKGSQPVLTPSQGNQPEPPKPESLSQGAETKGQDAKQMTPKD